MKFYVYFMVSILFLTGCKSKEARVYEFSQNFNKEERAVNNTNVKHVKAYYVNRNKVYLDFIFQTDAQDVANLKLSDAATVLDEAMEKNPEGKALVAEGVAIIYRIYNQFGIKIAEIPLKNYDETDLKQI